MIRLCGVLLSDRVSAEDAAQEVFLKAYRNLAGFRNDSSFFTWIYKIACRTCFDHLRARARRPAEALTDDHPDSSANRSVESGELLQKLLGRLSEDARAVLVLREMDGLSYEEIAHVLDCSVDAVKSRLRRARESAEEIGRKEGLL